MIKRTLTKRVNHDSMWIRINVSKKSWAKLNITRSGHSVRYKFLPDEELMAKKVAIKLSDYMVQHPKGQSYNELFDLIQHEFQEGAFEEDHLDG